MKNRTLTREGFSSPPAERNIRAIAEMEQRALHERSTADRLSDAVVRVTGSALFALGNCALFGGWILINTGKLGNVTPFDPFPFNLLTLVVSLEAIVLSIFVLMSQNRMTRAADKRAHLDLQVNLLAEQELTTMLQMLHAMCAKLQVEVPVADEQMRQFLNETDIHKLATALDRRLPSK